MSKELRMALIGVGRIGKLHAEHLAFRVPGARLVTVADLNEAAAKECAAKLGVEASGDYHALLGRDDIQAVAICSSTNMHATMIEEAAAAGKQIFCEKPIDLTLKRIDEALAAVDKAGVILQLGFNRRFDANYARVRQAIESGEIGEPQIVHIISRDPGPPPVSYIKVSGGMFLDMTIHDFDMARFLLGGEKVDEVYTAAGVTVDPAIGEAGDVDTAVITLKFANGVIATIDNCRRAVYGYDQRVEVLGSKGAIQTGNNYPNSAVLSTAQCVGRDLPLNFFMDRYTESFLTEMRLFVDAVLNGKPVAATGADARAAAVLAIAARQSYDEGRPVKVNG